jgi:adenylyl cyclase-associated protein
LIAFDKFFSSSVYKFADTCDDLGDMENLGQLIVETFEGMRYVVVLASRSKQPADMTELQPHLTPITAAVTKIRALRLKRDYDNHVKAVMEMLACASWVTCRAPSQLPAPFVKECVGSADFWSNRIRKEFKGKEAPLQIAFCENSKKLLLELAAYIQEHHTTGVTFNPKGVSIAEAAIVLSDTPASAAAAEAAQKAQKKRSSVVGDVIKGGNAMGVMSELAGRRTGDGTSAATGLKKVSG